MAAETDPSDEQMSQKARLPIAYFHQAAQAHVNEAKNRPRTQIIPRLVQHWVASLEAAYSSYGDSGAIDAILFRDAVGQRIDRTALPAEILE